MGHARLRAPRQAPPLRTAHRVAAFLTHLWQPCVKSCSLPCASSPGRLHPQGPSSGGLPSPPGMSTCVPGGGRHPLACVLTTKPSCTNQEGRCRAKVHTPVTGVGICTARGQQTRRIRTCALARGGRQGRCVHDAVSAVAVLRVARVLHGCRGSWPQQDPATAQVYLQSSRAKRAGCPTAQPHPPPGTHILGAGGQGTHKGQRAHLKYV